MSDKCDAPVVVDDDFEDMMNDKLIRQRQDEIDGEIASNFPMVGDLLEINKLYDEYTDEIYRNKVKDLETKYKHIRKIRPDGNCFYRAFIFAHLESLLNNPTEAKAFNELVIETRKGVSMLGFSEFMLDDFYEAVSILLIEFLNSN